MAKTTPSLAADEMPVSLSRDLGLLDITMIGVGAMIGAGIFVLTGIAAGHAGPGLLLAFFLNGLIAIVIGAAYAELGSCFPEAGGGYLWVKQGMSDIFGFLSGWMSWFAHAVACSLYALGFGSFATELLQMAFGPLPFPREVVAVTISVLVALLFTFINFRGASETGLVGNIVTSLKIFILLVLVGFGVFKIFGNPNAWQHYTPFLPEGWLGVFVAMGLTFIAFEGYEIIAQSGEEVKDPAHNIPRAIFLSIGIVVVIYLLVAFVVLGGIEAPPDMPIYKYLGTLGELGMAEAAGQLMPYGKVALLLAGLASTMSALNATIYSSSRVSFAMGRDGNLPDIFGRIHPLTHTPHYAIFISGALIILMAIALPIEDVAASADIMFLLLFIMVCYSLITLRERRPDLDRQFTVPLFPYWPIVGIVACLALSLTLFELSPIAWYTTIIWIAGGVAIYLGYGVRQQERRIAEAEPILLEEIVAIKQYSVMVPVSDIGQARELGKLGAILAAVHDGELLALHVIRVPRAMTISEGRIFLRHGRHVLDAAIEAGKSFEVPVRTMIRLGRNIGQTIMNTARERRANLMLLGWPGYTHSRDVAFGSVIDLISKNPPCHMAVVRFRRPWEAPHRLLLPCRGRGGNVRLAFALARDIISFYSQPQHGGHAIEVYALHVTTPGQPAEEVDHFRRQISHLAEELDIRVHVLEQEADNVVTGIVSMIRPDDVVIMGASEQGLFEQRLFGNIPEQVMRLSPTTIIMCKSYQGEMVSWLRRLLLPQPVDLSDPNLEGIRRPEATPAEVQEAAEALRRRE